MTANLKADLDQIGQTVQSAKTSLTGMQGQFKIMDQRTDEVVPVCRGAMANALGDTLSQLRTTRDRLINQVGPLLDQMGSARTAIGGQDSDNAQSVRGAVASTLNATPGR